jgi:hypothetical protein
MSVGLYLNRFGECRKYFPLIDAKEPVENARVVCSANSAGPGRYPNRVVA